MLQRWCFEVLLLNRLPRFWLAGSSWRKFWLALETMRQMTMPQMTMPQMIEQQPIEQPMAHSMLRPKEEKVSLLGDLESSNLKGFEVSLCKRDTLLSCPHIDL